LQLSKKWKADGYKSEIIFLRLSSPSLALQRIQSRVIQGGHNVPEVAVLRRFHRGWKNFRDDYRTLAGEWTVYDNSEKTLKLLEKSYETEKR
ncbi:MAG: Zeta toxin family protein, partial [Chthoniobacterales bacterium]